MGRQAANFGFRTLQLRISSNSGCCLGTLWVAAMKEKDVKERQVTFSREPTDGSGVNHRIKETWAGLSPWKDQETHSKKLLEFTSTSK